MPVQLSVKVRNAKLVSKQLEGFTEDAENVSRGRIRGRMISAQKRVTTYPARYAGTPKHRWASAKQRRYVMWAIKQGIIKVPYQRTGGYMRSWRIDRQEEGYTLTSTYPAARHIAGTARDPDRQYHLHKTRWTPLRTAVEEAVAALPKEIRERVTMVARKRGF